MPKRQRRPHRTWVQRLVIAVNCVLVMACLGAATGLMRVRHAIESLPVVDIGSSLAPGSVESSAPRNVLIIGTDNAEGIDKNDPVMKNRDLGTSLADVIMILRIDPGDHSVRLISIPRDSRVELPSGRMGRINAAMAGVGGEANLVRTIKHNFGIPIDNYIQLDFLGFRKLVEVLDGVPVYFTTPVRDRNSGLAIAEAGCHILDPNQALAYARSRHFFFYDNDRGKWRADDSGDLGRITRQQDFIKRALRSAAEKGLRNPTTALSLVNAASSAVRMDTTLDVGTLVALVRQFQNFNPDSLQSMQVPTRYAPRGGVAYQDVVWNDAEPLLKHFRGVSGDGPIELKNIIVEVSGGSSSGAETALVEQALDQAGFNADTWNAGSNKRTTTIFYGPSGRDAAIRLAAQMESMPEFKFDKTITGFQARLNLGSDFDGIRKDPVPVDQLPAEELPPPVKSSSGDSTSSTAGTTPGDGEPSDTTEEQAPQEPELEVPGVVPTDPDASALCR